MRIIPVIDLLHGEVVRGIGGKRSEYRPIRSQLAADARPATVAAAFVEHFGFDTAYVADLDAIMGGRSSTHDWKEIAASGLKVWLDAGIGNFDTAKQILNERLQLSTDLDLVIGLESLETAADLADIQYRCNGRAIFSLDMRLGAPLCGIQAWKSLSPLKIAVQAINCGTNRLIVLDLADVGESGGTRTLQLCRELRNNHPHIELIAGGGVRGLDDLKALADAGCDAVLVASALHDGRVKKQDIAMVAAARSLKQN